MISKSILAAAVTAMCALSGVNAVAQDGYDDSDDGGAVYTMTNAASGNQIVVFKRDAAGFLSAASSVATTGAGAGGGVDALGSQHSLVLSRDEQWLLAVNAGSNEISVLRADEHSLKFAGKVSSGGNFPTSIAIFHDLVYVLNAGASPNITGFTLHHNGQLTPIPNSTRALSGAAFGEVSFDQYGESLVVTDKGNSKLLVYGVSGAGLPAASPVVTSSNGMVPFAVIFDRHDHALVVEAGSNAVSSYAIQSDGSLQSISSSVANGQKAACWIAASGGRYVFTTNPGTHSISSYRLNADSGALTLISGIAATGTLPLDLAATRHGHYLYAIDAGSLAIDAFRVEHDGSLTNLGPVAAGVANYVQGIAVR